MVAQKSIELQESFETLLLDKLKLGASYLTAATTDTAPNMNSFGKLLENKSIPHVYCTDHELHNTCKLAYSKNQDDVFGIEHSHSYQKGKEHIHHFNHSTQATEKLKQTQALLGNVYQKKPVGIIDDVVTRWWSTYDAIDRLLYLRKAITTMHANSDIEKVDELSNSDWENLKEIVLVLKPFRDAQKYLEGQKYVNASLVCSAVNIIRTRLIKVKDVNGTAGVGKLADSLLKDFSNSQWKTSSEERVYDDQVQR